jgi:bifunctional DNA-binding transcriptional regulator/antitoxin component of YhaV-PrlF toxin-antitoxin module
MRRLTVTAKGQVTFRKDILQHLGVSVGDKITVEKLPNGRLEVRAEATGNINDVFGMLKKSGQRPVSIEELNTAIADSWAGKR